MKWWKELWGNKVVSETIALMSQEEREEAFRNECVACVISDGILDDEEKKLLDALKILYGVSGIGMPEAEWMTHVLHSNEGRNKSELDAELNATIDKRLFETGHINLPEKPYQNIQNWRRYREKESDESIQETPGTSLPDDEVSASISSAPEASDDEASASISSAPEASDDEVSASVSPVSSSETITPSDHSSILDTPGLTLTAGGQSISFNITTKLSEYSVRQCGEDSQFWDNNWQMTLENRDDGWYVVPNNDATNETILNSKAVTSSAKLSDGDELGVGREVKNIIKLPLNVTLS